MLKKRTSCDCKTSLICVYLVELYLGRVSLLNNQLKMCFTRFSATPVGLKWLSFSAADAAKKWQAQVFECFLQRNVCALALPFTTGTDKVQK
ncbi:hypothetical protein NPIL_312291 [Nephila pilipes]|uniref:Uncharacterized protein n=1 Tax=Nephila pilipes TaxID=299642 RepID=A0A8X6NQ05_NEPPI|nr:hypothetical protein NPIL_312291 [Nephila pilipes]